MSQEKDSTQVKPRGRSWFKTFRDPEADELIKSNPLAYMLADIIARRARWNNKFNLHGLKLGEAFLGDFENYGMTRQQYRTAREFLEKFNFATFKSTNKGTVAKLTDTRLFETVFRERNQQNSQQATNAQPTPNHQPTTNKEVLKRGKKEKEHLSAPASSDASALGAPASEAEAWKEGLPEFAQRHV